MHVPKQSLHTSRSLRNGAAHPQQTLEIRFTPMYGDPQTHKALTGKSTLLALQMITCNGLRWSPSTTRVRYSHSIISTNLGWMCNTMLKSNTFKQTMVANTSQ